MENGMNPRLEQLLQSYGADQDRWPAADREDFNNLTDGNLADARRVDRLLELASVPAIPDGAVARLLERIAEPPTAELVQFLPRSVPRTSMFRYAAAFPLAASLALGIYLGAKGTMDFMLPAAITSEVTSIDDVIDDLGGVGEAEAYAEDGFT